jgi:hypothetical protein
MTQSPLRGWIYQLGAKPSINESFRGKIYIQARHSTSLKWHSRECHDPLPSKYGNTCQIHPYVLNRLLSCIKGTYSLSFPHPVQATVLKELDLPGDRKETYSVECGRLGKCWHSDLRPSHICTLSWMVFFNYSWASISSLTINSWTDKVQSEDHDVRLQNSHMLLHSPSHTPLWRMIRNINNK